MNISDEAYRSAENAYRETLTDLRLTEGGGFKVASQVKRSIHAALEAAAPHLVAEASSEGDRDELAASIAYALDTFFHIRTGGPVAQDFVVADALLADGWRKQ